MPTAAKATTVAEIRGKFEDAGSVILADYRGLTVKEMQELRAKLREAGCEAKVYKNTLTTLALRELDYPDMDEFLVGPTAFLFAGDDPVAPAKAVFDFMKVHKALEVKIGYFEGQLVEASRVKAIASLPSREQLIAMFMGVALNPVRGFMSMANAPASAFARTLQAVADQKSAA